MLNLQFQNKSFYCSRHLSRMTENSVFSLRPTNPAEIIWRNVKSIGKFPYRTVTRNRARDKQFSPYPYKPSSITCPYMILKKLCFALNRNRKLNSRKIEKRICSLTEPNGTPMPCNMSNYKQYNLPMSWNPFTSYFRKP